MTVQWRVLQGQRSLFFANRSKFVERRENLKSYKEYLYLGVLQINKMYSRNSGIRNLSTKMYLYDTYICLNTKRLVQIPLIHEVQKVPKLNAVVYRNA